MNYRVFAADDDGLYSALVTRGTPAAITYKPGMPTGAHPNMAAMGYHPLYFEIHESAFKFLNWYHSRITAQVRYGEWDFALGQSVRAEIWTVGITDLRPLPLHRPGFDVIKCEIANGKVLCKGVDVSMMPLELFERWPAHTAMARLVTPINCVFTW